MDMMEQLSRIGIVPVIAINDAADAVPLAQALIDGGLPCAEVTFRTAAAADAIKNMTEAFPDMVVGAGTVLTCEQVDRAIAADALAEELSGSGKSVWVLGDGWAICEKALKERGVFCTVAPEELRWQTAFGVCLAAQSKTPTGAEDLLPVYLRLSQAERERQSRMNEA